jgi:hypothetical protein
MTNRPLMEISGFAELSAKIKLLANDKQKRTEILKILRKVAQGTVKAARRNVPQKLKKHLVVAKRNKDYITPEVLKKSIGVITAKSSRTTNPVVYVGPRAKGVHKGFFGHWVEYGVNIYKKGFKRKHSGSAAGKAYNARGVKRRLPGSNFMKNTYTETKGQVTEETVQSVTKYIQKRIDALSKR